MANADEFRISDLRPPASDLKWYETGLPWSARDDATYVRQARNAVRVRGRREDPAAAIDFLSSLQPLSGLEIVGGPRNDKAVFELSGLSCLMLENRGTAHFDPARLQDLVQLGINDRPGVHRVPGCPGLQFLTLWGWRAHDFAILREANSIKYLRIEGRRQQFTFSGLEGLTALEVCWVHRMAPHNLSHLESMPGLRYLHIEGPPQGSPGVLDLSAVRGTTSLAWLILQHCGRIASLRPLLDLPRLAGVAIGDCSVVDGDMTPLMQLRPNVAVSFGDMPHYSHTLTEVLRSREELVRSSLDADSIPHTE